MGRESAPWAARALGTFLFDLDGTLIDSIELIRLSYEHTLREHGGLELGRDAWLEGLGRPLAWQFARLTSDTREVAAMIETYRVFNRAHHDAMIRPFPGVLEAVRELRDAGAKLGVVTSKLRADALRGLLLCGFEGLFAVIVGVDDVAVAKPDPAPVRHALERLGASPAGAVMIGDSPHDLVSGRKAGTATAAVAWGPFSSEQLRAVQPDHWLGEPAGIARLLWEGSGQR